MSEKYRSSIVGKDIQEVLDLLNSRRSVRQFDDKPIHPEIVDQIITDGLQAPSACNHQMWHFVVVQDQGRKAELQKMGGVSIQFATAPVIIFLCFHKGWNHNKFAVVQSAAAAAYHMILSAHLRGYGCVWTAGIGNTRRLAQILDIPSYMETIGAIYIGRASSSAPKLKPPRRPLDTVRSWEQFRRSQEACYPLKPSRTYPFNEMQALNNRFSVWDPVVWGWGRISDFRGYAVYSKSPLAGAFSSKRYATEIAVEVGAIPNPGSTARFLEIMPFAGTHASNVLKRFGTRIDYHFAELSPNNIAFIVERIRREVGHDVKVTPSILEQGHLPHKDNSFDIVFLPQVLEAVPDMSILIDETARILKPGGYAIVSIRNMFSWYGLYYFLRIRKEQVWNLGPYRPISPFRLMKLVKNNFVVEEAFGVTPLPGRIGELSKGIVGLVSRLRVIRLKKIA